MAINLFPRELTRAELSAEAEKQGVMLPLPMLPWEEKLEPVDAELLSAVVEQLGKASAQLHFELVRESMNAPLMSMYVSGGHLIAVVYSLMGAAVFEVTDPQQVKRLLMSVCASMPLPAPQEDVQLHAKTGVTPAHVALALQIGHTEALGAMIAEEMPWEEVCSSLKGTAVINCTYDSEQTGTTLSTMLHSKEKVYTAFEQDGKTCLVVGSPYQLIARVNLNLMEALRDSLTE